MTTSNTNAVVEIFDDKGDSIQYKKVSARVAEFLEVYGPDKGYAIRSSSQDHIHAQPGLLAVLLEMAKHSGNGTFLQTQLSPVDAKIQFTCQLLKEDQVVAEASALKKVGFQKEYESGETAAFQRLMAKLGFGGEVFDEDESLDMDSQNLKTRPPAPVTHIQPVAKAEPKPQKADVQEQQLKNQVEKQDVIAETTPEPSGVDTPLEQTLEAPISAKEASPSAVKKVDANKLQTGLLRQLATLARVKGVDVPDVTTPEELKNELSRIHQLPLPSQD